MNEQLLLPEVDAISAPFWEGTARGELLVQVCGECGVRRFPPRPMCPHCHSLVATWVPLSGRGTIWSYVVAHPPLLPAYERLAPYNVIVVTADEDPTIRFVGNLVESPGGRPGEIDPTTIVIGEPVNVVFPPAIEDIVLPRWVRA